MRISSVLLLFPLILGCNDTDMLNPANEEENEAPLEARVDATTSLAFNPSPVTIRAGGTVTFAFQTTPHTVIFEKVLNVPPDIVQQTTNVEVERDFTHAGTFNYNCSVHGPTMSGIVIVEAATP